MLKIRLTQIGKRNKKMFRLIVSENEKDTFADALETLGSYDPHTKNLKVKEESIKSWIEQGAQMSPTVNNLLVENKIIKGEKKKANKNNSVRILKKKQEKSKS